MTRTAKTFKRGEVVEWRLARGVLWWPASYKRRYQGDRHVIRSLYGGPAFAVPSRRIRKRSK